MSAQQPMIRIRDLHKSFGPKRVLDGLDLDVGKAESVVVIGGSGTGKSVLSKLRIPRHPQARLRARSRSTARRSPSCREAPARR